MVEFPPHEEISGRPSHGDKVRAKKIAECFRKEQFRRDRIKGEQVMLSQESLASSISC